MVIFIQFFNFLYLFFCFTFVNMIKVEYIFLLTHYIISLDKLGLWYSTKRNETKQLVFDETKRNETSTVTCEITGVPSSRYEFVM